MGQARERDWPVAQRRYTSRRRVARRRRERHGVDQLQPRVVAGQGCTITGLSLYGALANGGQLLSVGLEGIILRKEIIPRTTPILIRWDRAVAADGEATNNFGFRGFPGQRFFARSQPGSEDVGGRAESGVARRFRCSRVLEHLQRGARVLPRQAALITRPALRRSGSTSISTTECAGTRTAKKPSLP